LYQNLSKKARIDELIDYFSRIFWKLAIYVDGQAARVTLIYETTGAEGHSGSLMTLPGCRTRILWRIQADKSAQVMEK
jgi:hypothetical protein